NASVTPGNPRPPFVRVPVTVRATPMFSSAGAADAPSTLPLGVAGALAPATAVSVRATAITANGTQSPARSSNPGIWWRNGRRRGGRPCSWTSGKRAALALAPARHGGRGRRAGFALRPREEANRHADLQPAVVAQRADPGTTEPDPERRGGGLADGPRGRLQVLAGDDHAPGGRRLNCEQKRVADHLAADDPDAAAGDVDARVLL